MVLESLNGDIPAQDDSITLNQKQPVPRRILSFSSLRPGILIVAVLGFLLFILSFQETSLMIESGLSELNKRKSIAVLPFRNNSVSILLTSIFMMV